MKFPPVSRRLARSAIVLRSGASSSPLLPLLLPNVVQRRTLFGWLGGKKSEKAAVENPVYTEFLKRKPAPPPPMVRGDLAGNSIFELEDARPKPSKGTSTPDGPITHRDPAIMAAALDPLPDVRRRWERKMVIREIRGRGRLSKTERIRRTERQSLSKSHFLKTSVKKLGPLARQIAGKTVDDALVQMRFSKKKAAKEVKELLEHARNEAIVKRGMALGPLSPQSEPVKIVTKEGKKRLVRDRSELYIDQAWVGRGTYGRDLDHRARGQINILRPPTTSISVILKEEATRVRLHEERVEKQRNRKLWVALPNRPITAQRQYYSW
ncbi:MAG: 54S ribosomal protein L22, mitochondrial [Thelocarpon impressellum]|nr:MAG: 54S ribosomal protein L22, mitochondrial [Thelocarpon impressellum]